MLRTTPGRHTTAVALRTTSEVLPNTPELQLVVQTPEAQAEIKPKPRDQHVNMPLAW